MSAQTTLPTATNLSEEMVFISQTNQLVTDSFLVAQFFGKQHKHVLEKIRNLDCSHEFTGSNFGLCHKNNELQNNKIQPFYQMTKDGFMFLVMGFTGKKAATMKEAFIGAFNAMADKLTKQVAPAQDFNPNLYKDFVDLTEHVNFRVLVEIQGGKPKEVQFGPDDAFVCSKEKILKLMSNPQIFSNQEIIQINNIAANRLSLM